MNEVTYTFLNNLEDDLTHVSGRELIPILKKIDAKMGIEIGVDEGLTSRYFLSQLPELKLFGVDPYSEYLDWNGNYLNQDGRNNTFDLAMERLNKFDKRYHLYRMTSDDAVDNFVDNSYDFIFIDGLHEYKQLLKDCANYFPKIRKGGVFAGHDYTAISGVKKAVDEFAKEVGATPIHLPEKDVWYWIKD
jgi:predicted O-methyltransferase YrrM